DRITWPTRAVRPPASSVVFLSYGIGSQNLVTQFTDEVAPTNFGGDSKNHLLLFQSNDDVLRVPPRA
ncbi:MAG: hypothetical protein ACPG4T_18370, partial [Nannocystaceae bacterium]